MPLTRCLILRNSELASKFISRGAKVNSPNHDGKSPLIMALLAQSEGAVNFLLANGADPHIEDLTGNDACDYAKNMPRFSKISAF